MKILYQERNWKQIRITPKNPAQFKKKLEDAIRKNK